MEIKYKQLLLRITIWLVLEISLNILGMDDLADFSEFIFEKEFAFNFSNDFTSGVIVKDYNYVGTIPYL